MRRAISDPTAGERARQINAFPGKLRRRVDPTDPTYGTSAEESDGPRGRDSDAPDNDTTDARTASRRAEMRVLVRRTGRGVGASLPQPIAGRPMGHVHGLARGEGSREHLSVLDCPVGQVIGCSLNETRRARPAAATYVLRLRGLRSA